MKRFHPLLIALLHAAVSFAMLILVVSSNPANLFSLGYALVFVLMPGIIVPVGIIWHGIQSRTYSWWLVGLGCVISIATTFTHIYVVGGALAAV